MSLSLAPDAADDARVKGEAPAQTRVAIEEAGGGSSDGQLAEQARGLYINDEEKRAEPAGATSTSDAAAASASASSASASSAAAAAAASSASASPAVDLSAPFQLLSETRFAKDTNSALRRYYTKWNIAPTCHMHSRSLAPMPSGSQAQVTKVSFTPLRTSCTDLHLFDKLWTEEPPIVYGSVEDPLPSLDEPAPAPVSGAGGKKPSSSAAAVAAALAQADLDASSERSASGSSSCGTIRKCFEDEVDGIPLSDELRRALLDRDSDNFELFSPQERQELLFVLLVHLAVGGGLCQYENSVGPYLASLKLLYRDLVSVRTNRNTDQLEVTSTVLRVTAMHATAGSDSGNGGAERSMQMFGAREKDKHHLCVFSIDPQKRHITTYYFAHTSAW